MTNIAVENVGPGQLRCLKILVSSSVKYDEAQDERSYVANQLIAINTKYCQIIPNPPIKSSRNYSKLVEL